MNRMLTIPALAALVALGSCSFSKSTRFSGGTVDLGSRTDDSGTRTETFKLKTSSLNKKLTLVVQIATRVDRPDLGLTISEIDKGLAQEKNLVPFKGLFVRQVDRNGPAGVAGVMPGDILIAVNNSDILYREQYDHILDNLNPPNRKVTLTVVRGFGEGKRLDLEATPGVRQVTLPSAKMVPLAMPEANPVPYAGIVAGTLPAEWTARVFGEERPTVLIGLVEVGSPAYLAGLRQGDRILSVDGQPLERAEDLLALIRNKGEAGESAEFTVWQRKGGEHRTRVDLADYSGYGGAHLPLVFHYDGTPTKTEWRMGPFGLLVDYEGEYRRRTAREANYKRNFSCLVDLVDVEWTPKQSTVTLFWFLKFKSR